jgi:PqqA peptide cyclase
VRQKMAAAAIVRELGFAFSINVVLHRANLDHVGEIIELAASLGADRLELANTQYYGWALENRRALMPTRAQVTAAAAVAEDAMRRYAHQMQILYVLPDYYESTPKPCYAGWGNFYLVVMPDGRTLPCHGATHITTLTFDSVRDHPLRWIWEESSAFNAFRGDAWMKEPCRTCPKKGLDFGGCRCQAFALTGDAAAADPVCTLTPARAIVDAAIGDAASAPSYQYRYLELEPRT